MYTSGIGLSAGLQLVRNSKNYPTDEAPNNLVLSPIVFASKSLSSAETIKYNNKEIEIDISGFSNTELILFSDY